MAPRFYRLRLGEQKTDVVEHAETTLTGPGIEIAVDTANVPDRAELYRLIEEIRNAMLEDSDLQGAIL
ncbi:MAG: hypothetical protein GEU91_20020 [Rhizobiales bacterium]|nr:hypothetical protein [Hyphomicrobiales bacterium]